MTATNEASVWLEEFLVAWADDLSHIDFSVTLEEIFRIARSYQRIKNKRYQGHWASKGLLGWWTGCISRQTMRMDPNILQVLSRGEEQDVRHLLDTLVDTAMFSLMGIQMLHHYFPEETTKFLATLEEVGKDGN